MANKKINQLVLKTTIQSTDLFPLGDPTTGQLFKKTVAELQAAIGGAVISVNGLVGTVVLDTDDIQELATPTNRYFTEARARAAISLTTTGNSGASTYSSSTGVLNVPTYTLAGLGGITASFLSGGTGITYNSSTGVISYSGTVYTDASIRALLSGANGISYNSSTGQFTYSGTVYTDSSIRALLSGTAPITYNSSTGAIGITQATTSTDGYLSSTDWNTFNGKQSALTFGNLTEATSSVLTITGGTGSVIGSGTTIQVKQASSTVSGFLSSTDWNTFNGKQNVITNPVTGTGTTNYVTKWTSSSAIGNSLIFDNGTHIGIGTTSPNFTTSYGRALSILAGTGYAGVEIFGASSTGGGQLDFGGSTTRFAAISGEYESSTNGYLNFRTLRSGTITNAMRITSAGNVGIGTSSPNNLLELYNSTSGLATLLRLTNALGAEGANVGIMLSAAGNGAGVQLRAEAPGGGNQNFSLYVTASNTLRSTPSLFIQGSSGNVGIGTSSPNQLLTISASSGSVYFKGTRTASTQEVGIELNDTANSTTWLMYRPGSSTQLRFYSGNGDHGAITYAGNWLLGTTTDNGERLYVSGSIRATGSITANSDARLKKNIERIENALEKVGQISGYTYNTIYDEDRHAGVIAQEIDKVLPEIVNKGNDGLMGVEYGNISALLIEAIKEQKVLIESLQAKVEALSK